MCDGNYCFTLVDLGSYDGNNDSGILAHSEMGNGFEDNKMFLPDPKKLSSFHQKELPYFILGDDIFALKPWHMRGYRGADLTEEQRVFNYRLSRARRTIENAFGILSARRRIFSTPIRASVENAEKYVLACFALNNYLRKTNNATYTPSGFMDSECSDGTIISGD